MLTKLSMKSWFRCPAGGPERNCEMRSTHGALRVCCVITEFDAGGAERILLQTMQRLDQKRFPSFIVSLRLPGSLSPEAERCGVEIIHFGMGRRSGPGTIWRLA